MSKREARGLSHEFKQGCCSVLGGGERVAVVASEAGIRPKPLYDWVSSYRPWGWELDQAGTEAGVEARTEVGQSQGVGSPSLSA